MNRNMAKRTPLGIMRDTVFALFMRELRSRFNGRLGYFWALVEPMIQAVVMGTLWTLMGRHSLAGVPVALFMIVSIMPFKTFTKLLSVLGNSVVSNKGVMGYRQVEPIDPFITRLLIELATFVIVFVLLLVSMNWILGYEVAPLDFIAVVSAILLLLGLAAALGLVICSAVEYWSDVTKLISMISMPLMMVSAVFFNMSMVPTQYWYLFDWNPITHALELVREGYYFGYSVGFGSWRYLVELNLLFWCIGLALYHVNRRRFKVA